MKKTLKRIPPLLLAVLIMSAAALSGGTGAAAAAKEFTDVTESHEHYDAIMYCAEQGFVNGTTPTTFEPDQALTREQMALVWARTFHVGAPHTFADVTSAVKSEADQAIIVMNALGFFFGVDKNEFGRKSSITREQLATVASRTYLPGVDSSSTLLPFEDADKISVWAKSAVQDCVAFGLLKGIAKDGKLLPQNPMTRGEVCELIKNVMDYQSSLETKQTVTVTYYPNGATGDAVVKTLYKGDDHTVISVDDAGFEYAGHTFKEWNMAADGTGADFAPDDEISSITYSIKLYAQWLPDVPDTSPTEEPTAEPTEEPTAEPTVEP